MGIVVLDALSNHTLHQATDNLNRHDTLLQVILVLEAITLYIKMKNILLLTLALFAFNMVCTYHVNDRRGDRLSDGEDYRSALHDEKLQGLASKQSKNYLRDQAPPPALPAKLDKGGHASSHGFTHHRWCDKYNKEGVNWFYYCGAGTAP